METISILGTPVAVTTRAAAASTAIAWAKQADRAHAVEAADVHVIARARHEEEFGEAIRRFDLVCPDGMPLVWAINSQVGETAKLKERVSGAELMAEVFRQSSGDPGLRHFLLGGSTGLLEELESKLGTLFPGATVARVYSPPFGTWPPEEFERICAAIRDSGANLVWVGLGCPKQERWIADHLAELPPAVYFGVGAAFAFHAGHVARAPGWCQQAGLEWAYRLVREPRRLFRRYFTYNSLFLWYSLRDAVSPPLPR